MAVRCQRVGSGGSTTPGRRSRCRYDASASEQAAPREGGSSSSPTVVSRLAVVTCEFPAIHGPPLFFFLPGEGGFPRSVALCGPFPPHAAHLKTSEVQVEAEWPGSAHCPQIGV